MILNLREAKATDIFEMYKLSNLPSTRKYSIDHNSIDWETHNKWFQNVIQNDCYLVLVVTNENDTFLGQVRFEIINDFADISISLIEDIKGKGYALEILKKSHIFLLKKTRKIKQIIATINNENFASIKLFINAGYILSEKGEKFSKFVTLIGGLNEKF